MPPQPKPLRLDPGGNTASVPSVNRSLEPKAVGRDQFRAGESGTTKLCAGKIFVRPAPAHDAISQSNAAS